MKNKTNKQFMVLSALGIIIMVFCHLGGEYFKYLKAFPFIAIFIFISGYFYKKENEENIGRFIWHKFKKLMIPFFIINLIYGIIVNVLKHAEIINFGNPINLYTLFVQPFMTNDQFIFNFPAWFVPTLFLVNTVYVIIHRITGKTKYFNDYILFIILIIFNVLTVYFKEVLETQKLLIGIFKVMFFLPFFHMGYLYKEKWQVHDEKIPSILYLLFLGGINIAVFIILGNLVYDMHDFCDFDNNIVVIPFITSVISILFYTRIAKILSKWIGENRLVNYISNNTSTIMTHHLFVIFLFDLLLYFINLKTPVLYFNVEAFKKGWIYIYEIPGWLVLQQLIYVLMGITVPLTVKYISDKIKEKYIVKIKKV